MAARIFFSHTSADNSLCEWLAAHARLAGVEAYLAQHDVIPGHPLAGKVAREIRACHAFVVLLTASTHDSSYVHQEIGFARAEDKLVIPLVGVGVDRGQMAMLDGLEYISIDFGDPQPAARDLVAELTKVAEAQKKADNRETLIAIGALAILVVMVFNDQGTPQA